MLRFLPATKSRRAAATLRDKQIIALVVSSFGFTRFDFELVDFNFHSIMEFRYQFVLDLWPSGSRLF